MCVYESVQIRFIQIVESWLISSQIFTTDKTQFQKSLLATMQKVKLLHHAAVCPRQLTNVFKQAMPKLRTNMIGQSYEISPRFMRMLKFLTNRLNNHDPVFLCLKLKYPGVVE